MGGTAQAAGLLFSNSRAMRIPLERRANIEDRGVGGNTAPPPSVGNGNKESVQPLEENGAIVNVDGQYERTTLDLTSIKGYKLVLWLLNDKGAHRHKRGLREDGTALCD
jgi:hypothetical protein